MGIKLMDYSGDGDGIRETWIETYPFVTNYKLGYPWYPYKWLMLCVYD
jgi:hypothetical protein